MHSTGEKSGVFLKHPINLMKKYSKTGNSTNVRVHIDILIITSDSFIPSGCNIRILSDISIGTVSLKSPRIDTSRFPADLSSR